MQDWLGTSRQRCALLPACRTTAQPPLQDPMCYCLNPACLSPQNPDGLEYCQTCGAKLALGDRYWAVKPLGQGGFGKTFLATDHAQPAHPRCVIKQCLPPQQGTSNLERASALFRQEALRLQALGNHTQIPALLDALEQAGQPYLVQTFIDGPNLAQALAANGTFSEGQILVLLEAVVPILQFIHGHQIIHRDVKPANIIRRSADQTLFLVDLGAAKYATGTALAQTGTVIGSAEYTAPEQARGKAVFASDIYSLAVTCIHLLTGIPPFDLFDNANGCWVWRASLPQPLTNQRLGHLLDKMLQAATNQRYQSIQALQVDLAALRTPKLKGMDQWSSQRQCSRLNTAALSPEAPDRALYTTQFLVSRRGAITHAQPIIMLHSRSSLWLRACYRYPKTFAVAGGLLFCLLTLPIVGSLLGRPPHGTSTVPLPITAPQKLPARFVQPIQPVRTLADAGSLAAAQHAITSLALSPNGQLLASGSYGVVHLWNPHNGNLNRAIPAPAALIGAVAISPDGQTLVSTTDKGVIELRDLPSGNLLRRLNGLTRTIAISPDGQTLASGSNRDAAIQVWHLPNGALSRVLPAQPSLFSSVAFSPDGRLLVSRSYDGTIWVWQWPAFKLLRMLNAASGSMSGYGSVAISPDGQILIANAGDTTKVWNLHSGSLLRTLTPAVWPKTVTMIAMSPDGQTIASGDRLGTLQLWDLHTGALLRAVKAHNAPITAIIFSADHKLLISSSEDGSIKIWSVEQLLSNR